MEVITLEQIQKLARPTVNIPGYSEGEHITVVLQKPNMIKLAEAGKIPNHLLDVAATLLGVGDEKKKPGTAKDSKGRVKAVSETIDLYCRACLVEPSYEQIGKYLTEEQMAYIFNWARGEVNQLATFRDDKENEPDHNNGQDVPAETE